MSASCARSSMRRRATTGICSSPSRSVRHRHARDRRRRSGRDVVVGEARQVGLVGVGAQAHREALRPPVVAHARRGRDARAGCSATSSDEMPQRRDVLARDADRDGHADRRAGLELPHVDARARHRRAQRRLDLGHQVRRVVLVEHLDQHLRVVRLPLLGRHREPEARAAAADERGQRLQHLVRMRRIRRCAPSRTRRPRGGWSRSTSAATRLVAAAGASSGSHTST